MVCRSYRPSSITTNLLTGVFFLFGAGRLALQQSHPREAIAHYTKAMYVQQQYRNLHHISFWEIAMARLALWEVGEHQKDEDEGSIKVKDDVSGSAACWRVLEQEAGVRPFPPLYRFQFLTKDIQ